MVDAALEGIRSVLQACQLVILLPVATVVVAGRARWAVVAGAIAGVTVGGWLFVTRWVVLDGAQIRLSGLVVAASVIVLASRSPARSNRIDAAIAASAAVNVTQWWRPCVGVELGEILTKAPTAPFAQLLPTMGFMLGICAPLLAIGLAVEAWRPPPHHLERTTWVATALGVVLAGSVVIGRHGAIVGRLFEWSQ